MKKDIFGLLLFFYVYIPMYCCVLKYWVGSRFWFRFHYLYFISFRKYEITHANNFLVSEINPQHIKHNQNKPSPFYHRRYSYIPHTHMQRANKKGAHLKKKPSCCRMSRVLLFCYFVRCCFIFYTKYIMYVEEKILFGRKTNKK